MFITRLRLKGYKRLLVSGIFDFELNSESIYQIIIGTNGSGKSSILDELSPLPATPNQYTKGGMKEIELTHRGHQYRLVSDFSSNSHYFYQDNDTNLNDGKTITVQKALVEKWFGLTTDIQELLIGVTTFTNMAPAKRREWFTLMSGGDLDHAITMYQKFQSKVRDSKGVIKHLDERSSVENGKILKPGILDNLQLRQWELETTIQSLWSNKSQTPDSSLISQNIRNILTSMSELISKVSLGVLEKPALFNRRIPMSMEYIDETMSWLSDEYIRLEASNKANMDSYAHLQEITEALSRSDTHGVNELELKVESIRDEITQHAIGLTTDYDINDITKDTLEQTRQCGELFESVLTDIPDNTEKGFSQDNYNLHKQQIEQDTIALDKAQAAFNRINHRIEHAKAADKVQCPSCGYHWQVGVNPQELEQIISRSNEIQIHITQLTNRLDVNKQFIENADEYRHALLRWRRFTESYPLLNPLWVKVAEQRLVSQYPKRIIKAFSEWVEFVRKADTIIGLTKTLNDYTSVLSQAKSLSQLNGEVDFIQRLQHLESVIESNNAKMIDVRQRLNEVKAYKAKIVRLIDVAKQILKFKAQLDLQLENYLESTRNESYAKLITDFQIDLANTVKELTNSALAKAILEDINKDRIRVKHEFEAYKVLSAELSPIDGLIAELMGDFIGSVVDRLNAVIKSVWTYDMYVEPCGLESGSLDYKFPLVVKNSDLKVPDVSRASGSQVDIVDFAFKLLVMAYLDLGDFPIYLDELAPTLDEVHRINIIRYVRELLESKQIGQMFMISHYAESNSAFVNAQICVMDTTNILTIPNTYNHHVKIIRG